MHVLIPALRTPHFDPQMIAPHIAYLDELRSRALLAASGRFGSSDQTGGTCIVRADSITEAEAIAAADPLASIVASELAVWAWDVSWIDPR